jgi:hypothetical protein
MPNMTELMQNPFQAYRVGEWFFHYDPDLEMFMVCYGADGCDGFEEFGSYEAAVAFMQTSSATRND